jgi:hypothetical protein
MKKEQIELFEACQAVEAKIGGWFHNKISVFFQNDFEMMLEDGTVDKKLIESMRQDMLEAADDAIRTIDSDIVPIKDEIRELSSAGSKLLSSFIEKDSEAPISQEEMEDLYDTSLSSKENVEHIFSELKGKCNVNIIKAFVVMKKVPKYR